MTEPMTPTAVIEECEPIGDEDFWGLKPVLLVSVDAGGVKQPQRRGAPGAK